MKKALILVLLLSGCATYRPIVDNRGVDNVAYEADLRECQAYADQVSPAGHAVAGAAIGGGLSFLLALITRDDRGMAAGVGATIGAAGGAANGAESQINVIRNCMRGRGYKVLQ